MSNIADLQKHIEVKLAKRQWQREELEAQDCQDSRMIEEAELEAAVEEEQWNVEVVKAARKAEKVRKKAEKRKRQEDEE